MSQYSTNTNTNTSGYNSNNLEELRKIRGSNKSEQLLIAVRAWRNSQNNKNKNNFQKLMLNQTTLGIDRINNNIYNKSSKINQYYNAFKKLVPETKTKLTNVPKHKNYYVITNGTENSELKKNAALKKLNNYFTNQGIKNWQKNAFKPITNGALKKLNNSKKSKKKIAVGAGAAVGIVGAVIAAVKLLS